MFTPWPIGFVSTPYKETSDVPKGLGASHEAEGVITVLPDFELGLTDIEGFSHLIVLWEFDPAQQFELLGTPPSDNRKHGVFATRSPYRPKLQNDGPRCVHRQGRQARVRVSRRELGGRDSTDPGLTSRHVPFVSRSTAARQGDFACA